MTYGLYTGVGLVDNFPKFKKFRTDGMIGGPTPNMDVPSIAVGDGIGGVLVSILLWVVMSIVFMILLVMLEAVFWFSLFIILAMLYWLFFRALKFVFNKSMDTKGDIALSALYSLMYTLLYIGWIFGIVYLTEKLF